MYLLQFDGLFRGMIEYGGNSLEAGFMSYGWVIYKDGILIARGLGVFARGKCANANIAEYLALIEGLDALYDMGVSDQEIEVRGDAKSVIEQMDGSARVSSAPTLILYQSALSLSQRFEKLDWCWVPREGNRAADSLTRQAIRRMHDNSATYQKLLRKLDKASSSDEILSVLDLRVFQTAHS